MFVGTALVCELGNKVFDGMTTQVTTPAPDIDLEKFPTGEETRKKSLENSQTSSTEYNSPSDHSHTDKIPTETEEDALSRVESVASAAFDPASRVPTNASRESGIIGWDGENDPENPRNWALWRKGVVVGIVAAITFFSPLASSMFAPGIPSVMETFGETNESVGTFCVSVYILGFAAGPLLWAPMSEMFGRASVFNFTNVLFVAFTLGCGFSNSIITLIILRFFAGFNGSACLALGGGVIADMITPDSRGKATAIWSIGPLMGPVIGPICGGFMSERIGWRWIFYVLTIGAGFVTVGTFIFLRETNPVIILERKAKKLRKETGNQRLRSALESPVTGRQLLMLSLKRPFKLLFVSPIVLSLSVLMGINYAYLYLCFTTFPIVFQEVYHFSQGISGLAYLGLGIGSMVGLAIIGRYSDPIVVKMTEKNGVRKPEYRLPLMFFAHLFIPIGLFWYGWSADAHTHWIVPIIGSGVFSAGVLGTFMPITTYLIDAFQIYAASALAANTVLRSLTGALLPLAGPAMFAKLGLGWGNSVLAFIALAFAPVPWLIYKYGETLRTRWPVKLLI